MRTIILLILLSSSTITQLNAVVVVHSVNKTSFKPTVKEKSVIVSKSESKHFSFKKLFKRVAHVFQFDLSDPVDGWLSLAILCFAGALTLGLLSWLLGSIYILNILTTVLGISAFACFIIWIIKAFS